MNKYLRMKNPPRFNCEWKFYAVFILDALTLIGFFLLAKGLNNLFHLSMVFAILDYILWLLIGGIMVRRPYNNPGQRQFFMIVESLFFVDKNHYHSIDPNRNYHGRR
ncbi:DUF5592 family protein [Enterococcus mundtii]|uniref:DUF5592 family protein n=1 Tax=Enterococcus mundtii TaxID=53346 RepID=UPI00232DB807|nr:DUF5592 family protein [Enterococcus mundtii]MDB7088095.1 DUF5592 family protein [Enterococcus mundtii]